MFGYIKPLKTELTCADFSLYRAHYCGICKTIGKRYGQLPRFSTNYDITFLSVLLCAYTGQQLDFKKSLCVLNPIKKQNCLRTNLLLERLNAANIILTYYKAHDGVVDKEGLKMRLARCMFKRSYKRAKKLLPKADEAATIWYERLRLLEKDNCDSIDKVADCFSSMLKEVAIAILGDNQSPSPDLLSLIYNIGKFVYLIDALDDLTKDFKKNRYNPFLASYPNTFEHCEQFIKLHSTDISFYMASTINRAIESFNNCYTQLSTGKSLLTNIVHKGLRAKCKEVIICL